MKLDPAVVRALSLNPSSTHVALHGGSGFSSTAKITINAGDAAEKHYFMKTGRGKDATLMLEGEHTSLKSINSVVPSLCPQTHAWGQLADSPDEFFLVTDFLDLSTSHSSYSRHSTMSSKPPLSLAAKLATLHSTRAPPPPSSTTPLFGFPVPTCCGDTLQPNTYHHTWSTFYSENRLLPILTKSERTNGPDAELRSLVEKTASVVVPRLLGDEHLNNGKGIMPVVVHGDLWSGNKGRGRIGEGEIEEVIFDPSSCYAHSEYELGIMRMFGGFGDAFMREYHSYIPKGEPVEEYDDRVALYEL